MSFSKPNLKRAARSVLTISSAALFLGCSHTADTASKTGTTSVSETTSTNPSQKAPPANENKPSKAAENKSDAAQTGAKVLDPSQYIGKVKMGYLAAQGAPEYCQKMFCYCGCDYTDEHVSLLDCFTSDHGVDCYICQQEAIIAFKLKKQGKSIGDAQKAVDLQWGKIYPFYDQPSDAIKKYWKTRLWAPGSGPTAAEKHDEAASAEAPTMSGQEKSGDKKAGCCGGKKDGKSSNKQAP